MDRTSKIVEQLQRMIEENWFPADDLKSEIEQLISGINNREINLMDYRKHDAPERFGSDVVEAIILADLRTQFPSTV